MVIGYDDILNVPVETKSKLMPSCVLSICDLYVVMFGAVKVNLIKLMNVLSNRLVRIDKS